MSAGAIFRAMSAAHARRALAPLGEVELHAIAAREPVTIIDGREVVALLGDLDRAAREPLDRAARPWLDLGGES